MSLLLKLRNRHFLATDVLIFLITPTVALAVRLDGSVPGGYFQSIGLVTVVFLAIKLLIFASGGLYSRFWRYASIDELAQIVVLWSVAVGLQIAIFAWALRPLGLVTPDFPRSIAFGEGPLALLGVGGIRYSVRLAERLRQRYQGIRDGQRVVVVGAGKAGVMIVQEMQSNPALGLVPVAFVDDDPAKRGTRIRAVPVLGKCNDLARVACETRAQQAIVAMPTAPGKRIREISASCDGVGLRTRIIPGMYELLGGNISVKQLRDIHIEDLLRREPIQTDTAAVGQLIRGKRVLVTGGGGSIGSELCRQVLRFEPEALIILGHGENSIFDAHSEFTRLLKLSRDPEGREETTESTCPHLYPVIADIRSPERVRAVFEEYRPQVIFHAAAHKHVPLMEIHPVEAIANNVLGTRNLLQASAVMGVDCFVMISTDKAVNPTSIMGASKRVAELLVHETARRTGKPYVAVRFGNVLGSRGSVVLSFKKQIAMGGPVTVTHPEMKRYFMTIPEAVQLVLQAAALGCGGEVFMLDMGEPVRIVDLARDMIRLSGLEEGQDIQIVYTGMRPGEKLFEELLIDGENYERTQHEKVFIAASAASAVPSWLDQGVATLEEAARHNEVDLLLSTLRRLVPEFHPVRYAVNGNGRRAEADVILSHGDRSPSFSRAAHGSANGATTRSADGIPKDSIPNIQQPDLRRSWRQQLSRQLLLRSGWKE